MSKAMAERVRLVNRQGKNGAGKNCIIFSLAYRQVITLDEDGDIAKDIRVCLLTSDLGRRENNMVSRARKASPATNSSSSYILSLHWWNLSSRLSIPCSPLHVGIYVKRLGDHWEDHIYCVEATEFHRPSLIFRIGTSMCQVYFTSFTSITPLLADSLPAGC
ncbi:hypothetical protein BKA82DRAFT_4206078 [Pisolithus tinctorius]|nr:hypothetical protein BKA82DRAFT_4206078 [Pisolithus tinctorius]